MTEEFNDGTHNYVENDWEVPLRSLTGNDLYKEAPVLSSKIQDCHNLNCWLELSSTHFIGHTVLSSSSRFDMKIWPSTKRKEMFGTKEC